MKLNNRKLQVHGIGLNMRETNNWGTPLEVFGEKRPSSIAVMVNSSQTPFCALNHSVILSLDLYLNKQSLGGVGRKYPGFLISLQNQAGQADKKETFTFCNYKWYKGNMGKNPAHWKDRQCF